METIDGSDFPTSLEDTFAYLKKFESPQVKPKASWSEGQIASLSEKFGSKTMNERSKNKKALQILKEPRSKSGGEIQFKTPLSPEIFLIQIQFKFPGETAP